MPNLLLGSCAFTSEHLVSQCGAASGDPVQQWQSPAKVRGRLSLA